jgi:hypothetical protein
MKRLLIFAAFILVLAVSVGLLGMYAVQWFAEPIAAHFLAVGHVHLHGRALPVSSVIQLSHYVGIAAFLFVIGQAIRGSTTHPLLLTAGRAADTQKARVMAARMVTDGDR